MIIKINSKEYSFNGYVNPLNSVQKLANEIYQQGKADEKAKTIKVIRELEDEREELLNSNDYECEIINYCLDILDRAIEIVEQGLVDM